jgi:hypothetical protein
MGSKTKGDIVKKQEQNMHSEHGIGPADNEATALVSGPTVDQEAIALLAYFYWEARGCPHDSPHEDWFAAEAGLRNRLLAAVPADKPGPKAYGATIT